MDSQQWQQVLREDLAARRGAHQYRRRRTLRALDATHVEVDGRRCVNFASNDYLGLTHHPRVMAACQRALEEHGAGAGGAGLICGYTPEHEAAEKAIADWKGTEASVLLPSGYQTNHAAIQVFASLALAQGLLGGVRFLIDKLSHASLIDAVRSTKLEFRVFPHNGLEKLRRLLQASDATHLQVVVTESVFSMDGDVADLPGLAELKREHPFALLLDEAHAAGVYGTGGAGYAAECGLQSLVDVSVVTLSKAAGCMGGGDLRLAGVL